MKTEQNKINLRNGITQLHSLKVMEQTKVDYWKRGKAAKKRKAEDSAIRHFISAINEGSSFQA